ncbi:MAG: hypothetical protein O2963_05565 [Proteobacteria bacterium]|nr:hypothetical protein [Pseudomonadota bacterium]
MLKPEPARKSLRQRVSDRKRGIRNTVPVSARKKRILKYFYLFLNVCQYLGLAMLLLALGETVRNEYAVQSWDLIIVYCTLFIFGRSGITILNSMESFRK